MRVTRDPEAVKRSEHKRAPKRALDPEHRRRERVRQQTRRAIARGVLVKSHCWRCKSREVQAHHDDYGRPLDVIWACPQHHADLHVERAASTF